MTGNPTLYIRQTQAWAIEQERSRHDQALYYYGEYAMIVLLYDVEDYNDGLIGRCPDCFLDYGVIAESYGQPSKNKCPTCYGTTFNTGWKARLIRPTLWDMSEPDTQESRRGNIKEQHAQVQFTWDFDAPLIGYVFRSDGSRWRIISQPDASHVRSGFQRTSLDRSNVALASSRVVREDTSSVAYMIPPTRDEIFEVLERAHATRHLLPLDFSADEVIRSAIRPTEEDLPPSSDIGLENGNSLGTEVGTTLVMEHT